MKRAAAAAEGPSKAAAVDPRGVGKPELARKPGEARIPKRKLALLLSYRGTQYHGLQRQTDPALKTIEGEMRKALSKAGAVSPENAEDLAKIGWSRSARTDKRVSAAQNIVAAKLEVENDDVDALVSRINDELPHDIRVFDAVRVTKSFNCKQSCDRRRYAYLLPSCLLASNDEIDAAFASVGYGPEKIEECRNAVALATAKAHRQRFEDGWSNGGDISGKSLALLAKVTPRSSEHTGVRLSQLVWQRGEEASALGGRQSGTPRGCSARLSIAPPAAIDARAVHGSKWLLLKRRPAARYEPRGVSATNRIACYGEGGACVLTVKHLEQEKQQLGDKNRRLSNNAGGRGGGGKGRYYHDNYDRDHDRNRDRDRARGGDRRN